MVATPLTFINSYHQINTLLLEAALRYRDCQGK